MSRKVPMSHIPPVKAPTQQEIDQYVSDRILPEEKEPTKRLTMDVPESLHREFKTKCSASGLTIADKVREMIEAWVKESP